MSTASIPPAPEPMTDDAFVAWAMDQPEGPRFELLDRRQRRSSRSSVPTRHRIAQRRRWNVAGTIDTAILTGGPLDLAPPGPTLDLGLIYRKALTSETPA